MAIRRRRRNLPKRNAKGRFVKAHNPVRKRSRRRRKNPILNPRRSRHVRATTRRRRRRTNPVRTNRRRRTVMAHRRRRRRKNPVLNPRRRRRATVRHRRRRTRRNPIMNPKRRNRRRSRRYARRHNAGVAGFFQKIDWKAVLFVSGGVFLGDKLTGLVTDKIIGMTSMIPASAGPWVKLGVGILAAGLAWKYQPAFGLGIAVGATNSILNQYVFGPAWGYVAPTLGVSGLGDYQTRSFKMDNWINQPTGANLQGMGNPLLSKGL